MKNILFLFSICVAFTSATFAQNQKYIDAMTKAINEFDTAQTPEQFLSVANKFERIALAEKNQWLPYYYSGIARVTSQFITNDHSKTDEILDIAQQHANIADSLLPGNSEIVLLKSMIIGARIMVDPQTRGQMYGMQGMMLNSQAMTIDPANPRPYLVMGQSLYYTPPQFGGGVDKACEMFKKAKEKYATYQPASDIHPDWGLDQVEMMLKQCTPTADPNTGKQE